MSQFLQELSLVLLFIFCHENKNKTKNGYSILADTAILICAYSLIHHKQVEDVGQPHGAKSSKKVMLCQSFISFISILHKHKTSFLPRVKLIQRAEIASARTEAIFSSRDQKME